MAALRVLAFAAATGRVGSVFLVGDRLLDWQISDKAADSDVEAAAHAQRLINDLSPDVVVTEELETARHKGQRTLALVTAIAEAAERQGLMTISLPHEHRYPNKYAEADALAEQYPELYPWKPVKRRFYDNEPRNTVIFEALALALTLTEGSANEAN